MQAAPVRKCGSDLQSTSTDGCDVSAASSKAQRVVSEVGPAPHGAVPRVPAGGSLPVLRPPEPRRAPDTRQDPPLPFPPRSVLRRVTLNESRHRVHFQEPLLSEEP